MNIPIWKKWVSYLFPLTLETASSRHNPNLSVVLDRGRLQLLSGNAIYSWDDLYHNFTRAFRTLQLEEHPYGEVLVLGLGLGSVPYILEKVYGRRYRYTAIEWDETVAGLASKYTLSRINSPIDIVTADAGVFIELTEQQFDMVVIDIFEDDYTPGQFETSEFLEQCESCLFPGGLILYNRLYNSTENIRSTEYFFENTFHRVFPEAWKIDTGGNWILVSRKS